MLPFTGSLGEGLLDCARRHPDHPALWAAGQLHTYRDLFENAGQLSLALSAQGIIPGDRVAILSSRSITAYAGILATLLAGCTYVPLNTLFRPERNGIMLQFAGARALILDDDCAAGIDTFLDASLEEVRLVFAGSPPSSSLADRGVSALACPRLALADIEAHAADPHSPAYILFTSGTTGAPKGVQISHANVANYVRGIQSIYRHGSADRILQLADLTFDISVHDMFVSWTCGASLFSVPERTGLLTGRFIGQHGLTSCFLGPSGASRMLQQGRLGPGRIPSVDVTFFCGESLPIPTAEGWQEAAPNGRIFNLYGPTESTVALTQYEYKSGLDDHPVVPCGWAWEDVEVALFGPDLEPAADGEPGEIFLAGAQLTAGYWDAPELNMAKFIERDGRRWYRTGDYGRRDPQNGLIYMGRADRQVKIRGASVDLQQIEGLLRRVTGRNELAILPWPLLSEGSAQGSVAFVQGEALDGEEVRAALRAKVEDSMVPDRIFFLPELPFNTNGKVDYKALAVRPELT